MTRIIDPNRIIITKVGLSQDPAEIFDLSSEDPKLSEELDNFLRARQDLTVEERRGNCVRTNLNYYIAVYYRDVASIL